MKHGKRVSYNYKTTHTQRVRARAPLNIRSEAPSRGRWCACYKVSMLYTEQPAIPRERSLVDFMDISLRTFAYQDSNKQKKQSLRTQFQTYKRSVTCFSPQPTSLDQN